MSGAGSGSDVEPDPAMCFSLLAERPILTFRRLPGRMP